MRLPLSSTEKINLVPIVYFIFAAVWIVSTDALLWYCSDFLSGEIAKYVSMLKGISFVALTSVLLSYLMNRYVLIIIKSNTNVRRVLRKINQISRVYKHNANELDAILNNSLVGMAFIDSGLVVRRVNKHFCDILGKREDQFVGRGVPCSEELDCAICHNISMFIDECTVRECPVEVEFDAVFPGGVRKWLQLSVSKIKAVGSLNGFVVVLRDITIRKNIENKIAYLSYYDFLTELPNRRLFYEKLADACKKAKRYDGGFGVLYMDINNFKLYNDLHGHEFGDAVLKVFAKTISSSLRESDVVARIGGDEFTAIVSRVHKRSSFDKIINKLNMQLAGIKEIDGIDVSLTASIGLGMFPDDGDNVDSILNVADRDMYIQKDRFRCQESERSPLFRSGVAPQ